MAIYDRWGNNLFLRTDFPPDDADYGWDGSYRDKSMDPGVYIYVIEVILPDGEKPDLQRGCNHVLNLRSCILNACERECLSFPFQHPKLFMILLSALIALSIFPFGMPPQACNGTINAGPDQILCYPGGNADLNGFFSGNEISSLEWTPAAGLSDPMILNPSATVNQTTTYTLTIKAPSGEQFFWS